MLAHRLIVVVLAAIMAVPFGAPGDPTPDQSPMAPIAQVVLTGRITEEGSGRPLQSVQVSIENEARGTVTNRLGMYTLTLPAGWAGRTVAVLVQQPGFAPTRIEVTLTAGSNILDLSLAPSGQVVRDSIASLPQRLKEAVIRTAAEASRMVPAAVGVMYADARRDPLAGRYNPNFNTEGYAHIQENVFLPVGTNPLSTFSIDVDKASYANVRRFIHDGIRPPIDAVRIEELINYFPYGDAAPTGRDPLAIHAEVAPAPWQPLHQLVRIALKGRPIDMSEAPASNLVFLLDVSGSMNSPDKLPLLKTAFGMLVDQLRPEDRVAIVVYAGAAGLVLPSTPGTDREAILSALHALEAGGSTAGGAGIRLAYQIAAENHIDGGNNRVILATDGDFNIGASSDSEMIRLIEEKREQGTFLSVLGFGTGNLKDAKMEQIADHGNGNFFYIDTALEARKVLVSEMGGTLLTIAKDVKIQVEFNPTQVAAYRLIGYENRLLADEDFNDDTKDAGELGAGHSVTALYEIIPAGVDSPVQIGGVDPLRYREPTPSRPSDATDELLFVKLRYKNPDAGSSRLMEVPVFDETGRPSADFRFASAVAAWGMLLRDSEYCDSFTLEDVADLARGSLGEDPEGYRSEFIRLVNTTRTLGLLESGSDH